MIETSTRKQLVTEFTKVNSVLSCNCIYIYQEPNGDHLKYLKTAEPPTLRILTEMTLQGNWAWNGIRMHRTYLLLHLYPDLLTTVLLAVH